MGNEPKRANVAVRSAQRAALALLAIWCVQASAANSGAICDQAVRADSAIDTAIEVSFNVEVADLGSDGSVVTRRPDLLADDRTMLPAAISPPRFETSSRVTKLLRQIFEEAAAEQFSLDEEQNPVRANSRESVTPDTQPDQSAVELTLPADRMPDEAREELPAAPDAATEFPGMSDEEYSRYRRQMYRKDI